MCRKLFIFMFALIATLPLGAETKAESIINQSIAAAGGQKKFEALGVIKMEISESETLANGEKKSSEMTAYLETNLQNSRLEFPNGIVVVRNGDVGWATYAGKLDDRKQTPRMAPGACRQKLIPLLLPFSLKIDGPTYSGPKETTFKGKPASRIGMRVENMFFQSPLISTQWNLFFPKDGIASPIARYLPVEQFIKEHPEGMEFEIVEKTTLGGVQLPSELVIRGVDTTGKPGPHQRHVTIRYSIVKNPNRGLFLSPDVLAKIEEGAPVQ